MYYSNNSLFYIDHELEVCAASRILMPSIFFIVLFDAMTFHIAAAEKAGGSTIEEIKFCQLSAVIGAKLWSPARFSGIKYLIQSNATNYTATILTVLQSEKGCIGKYN